MAEHNASEAVEVLSSSEEGGVSPSRRIEPAELALLVSVFVVAACGLVYELAAGALAVQVRRHHRIPVTQSTPTPIPP